MKRPCFKLLLLLSLVLIVSCFPTTESESIMTSASNGSWVPLEKVDIPIESPQQSFYRLSKVLNHHQLTTYNPRAHSFDVFNLKDKRLEHSIPLSSSGPDKVEEVREFYRLSADSIVCFSRNSITVIGGSGQIGRRIPLSGGVTSGIDHARFQISVKGEAGINAGIVNGKLYVPIHDFAHPDYNEPERFNGENPLLGQLDLETNRIVMQDIHYPDRFRADVFGFGSQPQFTYGQDKIIYYFTGFPEVYIFDPASMETNVLSASIPGAPATPSSKNQPPELHLQQVIQYTNAVYDQAENALYQGVLYPKIPNEKRKLLLRKIYLEGGKQILTNFPQAHSFIGMSIDPAGNLVLPNMNGDEDNLLLTIGELN